MNWHRVEMHCHSLASDGDMSPEKLVERALQRGYEAIALADHNTRSNLSQVSLIAQQKSLVIVPAIEWTTFWGHIVVYGDDCGINWLKITKNNVDKCIKTAVANGNIVSLAHPFRIGTPIYCGCHNQFDINKLSDINCYELWSHFNPHTDKTSELGIAQWTKLLENNKRISAMYGYDWHECDYTPPIFAYTYVGVEGQLSSDSIITAMRNNATYITLGIELCLVLSNENKSYTIGESVPKGKYELQISVNLCSDYPYKNDIEISNINIIGNCFNIKDNSTTTTSIALTNNTINTTIDLRQNGYFYLTLCGSMKKTQSILAITSAIYVV